MKILNRYLYLIVILSLTVIFLCSCNKAKEKNEEIEGISLYFINKEGNGLKKRNIDFDVENMTIDSFIDKTIEELKQSKSDYKSPFNNHIKLLKYNDNQGNLELFFDYTYTEQDKVEELLLRASLVLSLTQFEGIDFVSFYVNDQPLTDSNGNVIGALKASNFTDINESVIRDYNTTIVSLYLANESGDKLVNYKVECAYKVNMSQETVIINMLRDGVKSSSYLSTLPASVKVNSITVKDSICYVDFNDSFVSEKTKFSDKLVIYSIVNSLSELPHISKVQISVNGKLDIKYGTINLNQVFSRSLDIVESTEVETTEGE